VKLFADLQARGVEVRILTNSLASTDVAIVHSGYARYREPLLAAGVDLWELNTEAGRQQRWFQGNSTASLHAKAMLIDRQAAFIGSVNLDARSLLQNTEIGLYVESAGLNRQLEELFGQWFSETFAWHLGLDGDGRLTWRGTRDGTPIELTSEPETSAWQRFKVWLLSLLPVESQI
jgi:putative cardiolipin synthase